MNRLWVALVATVCACGPGKSNEQGSTGGTDTAAGGMCTPNPAYACEAAYVCGGNCGPLDQFDANGCMRPLCGSDQDCGSGEACYNPANYGGCGGMIEECRDDWPDALDECLCVQLAGACPQGWCVDTNDLPSGGTGGTGGTGPACGEPGSHTQQIGDECVCDSGYEWCDPANPDLFTCCEPDIQCPDPNSTWMDGLCYCNPGYDWCDPNDPDDFTCCDGTGSTGP